MQNYTDKLLEWKNNKMILKIDVKNSNLKLLY